MLGPCTYRPPVAVPVVEQALSLCLSAISRCLATNCTVIPGLQEVAQWPGSGQKEKEAGKPDTGSPKEDRESDQGAAGGHREVEGPIRNCHLDQSGTWNADNVPIEKVIVKGVLTVGTSTCMESPSEYPKEQVVTLRADLLRVELLIQIPIF